MTRIFYSTILLSCFLLASCAHHKKSNDKLPQLPEVKSEVSAKPVWSNTEGAGVGKQTYLDLMPTLHDNVLYASDAKGRVFAINATHGKTMWSTRVKAPIATGTAVGDGIVAVGTSDARVIAFQQKTGKEIWQATLSNEVLAAPVIAHQHVLVKTVDGKVYALNPQNGSVTWMYDHGAPSLILRAVSSPVVAGDKIVAGFSDGQLDVLSSDGKLIWQKSLAQPMGSTAVEQMVDINADPVVVNGVVYVTTFQGNIGAYALHSGELLWEDKMSSYSGLALNQEQVFTSDEHGDVWALDRSSGKTFWKQVQLKGRTLTAPALLENNVIVGDQEGHIHFLSENDGHFKGRVQVNSSAIVTTPIVNGKMFYVMTANGNLVAYRMG
ncbi:MAG: outer membrane protein assembly factor BamB [Proteobacteria bacterium]|nr:outer membrane protein assembly factor BamB [Pseudomonadota bacterium]